MVANTYLIVLPILLTYTMVAAADDYQEMCVDGELECYYMGPIYGPNVTFAEAREYCVSTGGDLASIHSSEQNEYVRAACEQFVHRNARCWIGFTTQNSSNNSFVFSWTDGTPTNYTNWKGTAPWNHFDLYGDESYSCTIISTSSYSYGQWYNMGAWYGLDDGYVCRRDAETSTTAVPSSPPSTDPTEVQRDCDTFAIDEYLDQCSVLFAETTEGVAASIEGIEATVNAIQNDDLPTIEGQVASNAANISDWTAVVGVLRDSSIPNMANDITALDGRLATAETQMTHNSGNITNLAGELSVLRSSSIPLIESDVADLDERLATIEDRVESFEVSSAKRPRVQMDESSANYPAMYAQYKDELVLALLVSNFVLMAYVACSCRNSRKGQYVEAYVSSDVEEERTHLENQH